MQDRLDKIRNHPLHKHLGVIAISAEDLAANLSAVVCENAVNPSGFYHGGVVYTLCDVCAYAAVLSSLPLDNDAVTHDIHVSMLRPAREGERIEYKARIRKLGRSLCFIDVDVSCDDRLIATARVTKTIVN